MWAVASKTARTRLLPHMAAAAAAVRQPVRSMAVTRIKSREHLQGVLQEDPDKLTVVDFTATWCGPCQSVAPFYEELSNSETGANFVKIDIDELQEMAVEAGVTAVPTFHFVKNNTKVAEMQGADREQLSKLVKEHA